MLPAEPPSSAFADWAHYACVLAIADAEDVLKAAAHSEEDLEFDLKWANQALGKATRYLEASAVDRSPVHSAAPIFSRQALSIRIQVLRHTYKERG